jgi:type VI secretion system protein ImpC
MKYTMNFGRLTSQPAAARSPGKTFRIAVLGDFSGRANGGTLETGEDLAKRKPVRIDVDNLDAVLGRMNLRLQLPIAPDGGNIEVKIASMDDFHPDQLYNRLEIFSELSGLRRRLKTASTFESAAAEVRSWGAAAGVATATTIPAPSTKPRGAAIPHGKLDDFARLIGRSTAAAPPAPVSDLIKSVVAPHIVAAPSDDQPTLVAAVDEALSDTMRRVLHHPDFQTLESLWRSMELLVREVETSTQLQLVLYDITAEELAADLSERDTLEEAGLYSLLVEQPPMDAQQGPLSVILGNYMFEQTPPHAELLGRIGKLVAAAQAPFIAAVSAECLKKLKPEEVHPLVQESWDTLRGLPQANYLGLTVPRFMLRWPYGAKTEPIDSFDFEEFTPHSGLKGMLWANGAIFAGLLLGKTFSEQGLPAMKPGTIMSVGDIPFYYYTDPDGDQVALPSTERLIPESVAAHVLSQNFMPVLCIRGRPEIRLGGFRSLSGATLAGPWSPVAVGPDKEGATAEAPPSAEVMSVQAFEAQATAEAENELDALLAGLNASDSGSGGAAAPSEPPTTEPGSQEGGAGAPASAATSEGSEDDLDALLAGLATPDETPGDTDMDPDLAALLADL